MLKILQARLQQYVNGEIPDVQAAFRKGRGTWDQIANIRWIIEKAREFQKNIYFCLLTMPKPLTVWVTINCGKYLKRWEYQITWPASWEICMQVKKQQLELDMEQQTGSKLGKEYIKAIYCHPAYLTYMKNTSWKMLGWMKLARKNINNLRHVDDTTLREESKEELKSLLMKVKEKSKNVGLSTTFRKLRSQHLVPLLHGN